MKRYAFYADEGKHVFLRTVEGPGTVVYRHEDYRGRTMGEVTNSDVLFEDWVLTLITNIVKDGS